MCTTHPPNKGVPQVSIQAEVEVITPERAQTLLEKMDVNRAVREGRVKSYASDLKSGNWLLTGESIKLDNAGVLIDGQHRLLAVIESGMDLETVVVYGIDPDAQIAMDAGAVRSLADHLKFAGEAHYRTLAAALIVRHNRLQGTPTKHDAPTHQRALAILRESPGLRDSVEATLGVARSPLRLPGGFVAALHYEMSDINSDDAERFWDQVIRGVGLEEDSAIMRLRERLLANAASKNVKLDRVMVWALVIKAWNAFREGTPVKQLRWRRGGSDPEPFPTLK